MTRDLSPAASEHAHQVALMQWATLARTTRPELEMLAAVPNGGQRHAAVAGKLKAEGVRAGYPDLVLNVPRAGYHGLFIELKSMTGRATPEQRDWLERLQRHGHRAVVCRGWLAAKSELENYLDGRA